MNDRNTEDVATRLRQQRKLAGLTQAQLAARANFSESLVKKVERGVSPASTAFVAGIARALGVTPSFMYGVDRYDALNIPELSIETLDELRVALDSYDDPQPTETPITLDQIIGRLERAGQALRKLRYSAAASELPALLHQLYPLAAEPGAGGERARAALHAAYRMAASIAGRYRAADLAAIASERHQQLAPLTGDPLLVAVSVFSRATPHLQGGSYREGLRIVDRGRNYLTDTPAGHAVAIQLHLRSAVLAARDAQPDLADEHLHAARTIKTEHNPPAEPYYNMTASQTNIDVHWCAIPMENYDGAESVRRASQVHISDPEHPSRVGHHHIDMARAWLLCGDRDQVLANLQAARAAAPFDTRQHPAVRETVLTLAKQDRRRTDSLSGFATWAGITL